MTDPVISAANRVQDRESPRAIKDLGLRLVEPHHAVPAVHDRDLVGEIGITAEITVTDPSGLASAVTLFTEYLSRSFFSK
jgi:hypothetical protein